MVECGLGCLAYLAPSALGWPLFSKKTENQAESDVFLFLFLLQVEPSCIIVQLNRNQAEKTNANLLVFFFFN